MKTTTKKYFTLLLAFLIPVALIFSGCNDNAGNENDGTENTENTEETPKEEVPLTPAGKGRVLFTNTTLVSTGVIVNAMSTMFAGLAGDDAKEPPDMNMMLDSMGTAFEVAFDSLETANPDLYGKFFNHPGMAKGMELANAGIPDGFKSLAEPMSHEDRMKYVDHIGSLGQDNSGDPVMTYYNGILEWFMEWSQEIEKDPELSKVMKDEPQS